MTFPLHLRQLFSTNLSRSLGEDEKLMQNCQSSTEVSPALTVSNKQRKLFRLDWKMDHHFFPPIKESTAVSVAMCNINTASRLNMLEWKRTPQHPGRWVRCHAAAMFAVSGLRKGCKNVGRTLKTNEMTVKSAPAYNLCHRSLLHIFSFISHQSRRKMHFNSTCLVPAPRLLSDRASHPGNFGNLAF